MATEYYLKNKESLPKGACERYQYLSEDEKQRREIDGRNCMKNIK